MTIAEVRSRVLVVDDEPINIHLLAEALGSRFELFFATSGEQALVVAKEQQIDLVVLDVMMPGMDGYTVCRHLKNDDATKSIPVIFVTARSEIDDEARGFATGGVDYIVKPFSPPTVVARVRTHIELKRTRDLLEELAMVDGLTAVANRRRFDETLQHEWRRALRAGSSLTLLVVDIDFFKQFNDTYGHSKGDECLRSMAGALVAAVRRPPDMVARYGGEEFAIVLPDTAQAGAIAVAEKVMAEVTKLRIAHEASSVGPSVTVSVGGSTVVPRAEMGVAEFFERADGLLYQAKREGRRRAILGEPGSDDSFTILPAEEPSSEDGGR